MLKSICINRFINEVFIHIKSNSVLILDNKTIQIISNLFKTTDLFRYKIILIDDINKKRQPFPLNSIYFIEPSNNNALLLLNDINKKYYSTFNLYFTTTCPNDIINIIGKTNNKNLIHKIYDFNLDFVLYDDNVFSLFIDHNSQYNNDKLHAFISTIGKMPNIRCQNTINNLKLEKDENSVLLILDRSFDMSSPIIHSFNLNSICHDLFICKHNTYQNKKLDDDIWNNIKNKHILECDIKRMYKEFKEKNNIVMYNKDELKQKSINEVKDYSVKMIKFKDQLDRYVMYNDMYEKIMKVINGNLSKVEESILKQEVTLSSMINIINNIDNINNNKFRILMLYALSNNKNIDELMELAKLNDEERKIVNKLSKSQYSKKFVDYKLNNITISKFVPKLNDIVISIINNNLSEKDYPYQIKHKDNPILKKDTKISRFDNEPQWNYINEKEYKSNIYIFINGGVTYTEICNIEEISKEYGINCIIGGTSIITFNDFVKTLL